MVQRILLFRASLTACLVWFAAGLISAEHARAEYEQGDVVEAPAATALRVESRVVYTTRRGERLVVEKEQDGFLWVKAEGGEEAWIREADVRLPTGPYVFPKTSIAIAEIPGFARHVFRFSEDYLGTSVDFDRGAFRASIYVYDLGKANIPDGHESELVEAQLKQAIGDIRRAEGEGRYSNVTELASGIVPLGDRARARWTSFQLTRNDRPMYSEIYVTARQGHFVKLRITYPTDELAAHRRSVLAVLEAVDQALAAGVSAK